MSDDKLKVNLPKNHQPVQMDPPKGGKLSNVKPADGTKDADRSALWSLIAGVGVLGYHGWIAIFQPPEVTIWWYVAFLPIILGVAGFKSKTRRPLAIIGMACAVVSLIIVAVLFKTVYEFTK